MASSIAYGSGGYGTGGFGGYSDITGSVFSFDTGGSMHWDSEDRVGTVTSIDNQQYSSVWDSRIRHGSVLTVDGQDTFVASGIEISGTTTLSGGLSFIQDTVIWPSSGLDLTFWDSTYIGGTLTDGTYVGGNYVTRTYNPIWLNYSLWYLTPPTYCEDSQWVIQGCPVRTAMNTSVGHYSASLVAPTVPGYYEIRWRYQKDQSSHALEIDTPFTVATWGISPFVFSLSDGFGVFGFGIGGFGGSSPDSGAYGADRKSVV